LLACWKTYKMWYDLAQKPRSYSELQARTV
jgi:hypothetical protein